MLSKLCVSTTTRRLPPLALPLPLRVQYYSNDVKSELSHPVKLHDDTTRTIQDFLIPTRINLLNLTLSPYLPTLTTSHSALEFLPPGFHFLFFPTSTSEGETLADGYEKHFAPQGPFKRRVWTQGSLKFENGEGLKMGEWAECIEKLYKIDQTEGGTNVWIQRTMKNITTDSSSSSSIITELRCLRYLNSFPSADSNITNPKQRSIGIDDNIIFKHTFTPSRILLIRFSFLTHNFHRIHIDTEYVKSVEQYSDILMHGSLSIVLIFTILHRYFESLGKFLSISSAKYMMLRPLFVDNRVTLTIMARNRDNIRVILLDNNDRKAVECIIKFHIP